MYVGEVMLSGLKKDIKKALKSGDAAKIAKALAAEQKKLDKAPSSKKAPKRADYVAQLQARLATVNAVPTQTSPAAVDIPVAAVALAPGLAPAPMAFDASGGGGSSGGGGGIPMEQPGATADAVESAPENPLMQYLPWALGAAALLFVLLKKKR
jgi:hypothetical protein